MEAYVYVHLAYIGAPRVVPASAAAELKPVDVDLCMTLFRINCRIVLLVYGTGVSFNWWYVRSFHFVQGSYLSVIYECASI